MTGKDKCKILKEIRKQIAEENDIEWITQECKHQGQCKGTCPKCESEVRKLERELELKRRLGKKIAVIGLSTACLIGLAGCSSTAVDEPVGNDLSGAIDVVETEPDIVWLDGEVAIEDEDYSKYYEDVVHMERSQELSGDVMYEPEQSCR